MKKNTKELERAEITFLDKMLPNIGENAEKFLADPFGFSGCFGKFGKRAEQKNIYWCTDCGGEFPLSEVKDYRKNPDCHIEKYGYRSTRWTHLGTCPCCGRPMKIDLYRYKHQTFEDTVAINATMGEWKITRYFALKTYCKPNRKANTYIDDIGATWTKCENTYHYIARIGGMFYSKYWKADTRHFSQEGIGVERTDSICERYDYPDFSIDAELVKRGIDKNNLHGMKLTQILDCMRDNPHFETLWKQGDWAIARFFKKQLWGYWDSVKIARRHGYTLNDDNLAEWRDMVDMLRRLHLDLRNPVFICPADLHASHNELADRLHRIQVAENERWRRRQDEWAREQARIAMQNREEQNEDYIKRRGKYFGLGICSDKGFKIVALQSIDDFQREGETLRHCVYACGYYNKANSLILSARDENDNPIETLEIDLNSFKILQCYGYRDTYTPLHKDILKTMTDNMWQVKELSHGKTAIAC